MFFEFILWATKVLVGITNTVMSDMTSNLKVIKFNEIEAVRKSASVLTSVGVS